MLCPQHSEASYNVGTNIILQMKTLMFKGLKEFVQGHTARLTVFSSWRNSFSHAIPQPEKIRRSFALDKPFQVHHIGYITYCVCGVVMKATGTIIAGNNLLDSSCAILPVLMLLPQVTSTS